MFFNISRTISPILDEFIVATVSAILLGSYLAIYLFSERLINPLTREVLQTSYLNYYLFIFGVSVIFIQRLRTFAFSILVFVTPATHPFPGQSIWFEPFAQSTSQSSANKMPGVKIVKLRDEKSNKDLIYLLIVNIPFLNSVSSKIQMAAYLYSFLIIA
ncbi:Uncharacterised protein [Legionella sainthelensi]|nr:Uncharacterised protein [Legionella sainthelensi]